jgi:predicted enzyme related to lactoylglutathione lyase
MHAAFVLPFACAILAAAAPAGDPPGRITGIGGVFLKSPDPKALSAWYKDVLGVKLESWGGAKLALDAPGHPPVTTWNPFPADTTYFAPSAREVMLDFAVDDLDAFLSRLTAHGVHIIAQEDHGPLGRFAWILDPDGTKLEFWEPKR